MIRPKDEFKILNKQSLAVDVKRLDIKAEGIASRIRPGQFVVVSPIDRIEKIPLTVVDSDPFKGTISLIFQEVGKTTRQLGNLQINDHLASLMGPLGVPPAIEKAGVVVCITTGIGTTQLLPICRAHKKIGNKVIGIIGAKTKQSIMLEAQMRLNCHKVLIATNDGSYIKRGLATDLLKEVLKTEKVDLVYAVGSVDLMEAVAGLTRDKKIKTRVALNPLILDATGICGACRVRIKGKDVFACVDGPEFDGHEVDYEDLRIRMNAFTIKKDAEGKEMECFSRKSIPSPLKKEPVTLTRFLSGILKSKP